MGKAMFHSHGMKCFITQQRGPTDTCLTWVPLGHSAPSLIHRDQEQKHNIRGVRKFHSVGAKMEVHGTLGGEAWDLLHPPLHLFTL